MKENEPVGRLVLIRRQEGDETSFLGIAVTSFKALEEKQLKFLAIYEILKKHLRPSLENPGVGEIIDLGRDITKEELISILHLKYSP